MEQLEAHRRLRNSCSSPDFLLPGEAILTLADLVRKGVGPDWQKTVSRLPNFQSKVQWMVEQTVRHTGLEHYGVYLTLLFEIDILFGNEDRHLTTLPFCAGESDSVTAAFRLCRRAALQCPGLPDGNRT